MDKRILSLTAALLSTAVYIVSRRFLQADPMETFVPALSGLGFVYLGLLVFQTLFTHVVTAAWAFLGGVCVFGWILILWPSHWAESWIAACLASFAVLARILLRSGKSYEKIVAKKILLGQALGFAAVAGGLFASRAGWIRFSVNFFSPAVLLFPAFFLLGIRDAKRRRSQSYIVQSAKRDTFESLVQGLAHELNNPLNFIYANIEPLREKLKELGSPSPSASREIEKILETMEEGVNRARGLIDRFRDFPTGEGEGKEKVDLNRVLEQTIDMLSPKWKGRLRVERRFGDVPEIAGYPLQLAQVFTNVIANACDATPEGGAVTVATQPGATAAKVSVKDTGHGISKERVARIFDPFFTTKEQGQGTGLGLAIALQLVKNHKGTIEVKSEMGKGSEFLISLPYS